MTPVEPPRSRPVTISVAAVVTLLLHGLVLWLILHHTSDFPQPLDGKRDTETTLMMIPNVPDAAAQPKRARGVEVPARPTVVPRKPKPQKQAPVRASRPRPVPDTPSLPALARTVPPPEPATPPVDDFSSRLAAKQQQRAEAESQERATQAARGTPEQQDNERGKQAALANIASSLKSAGIEKESGGGLFQLQSVGAHNAEFLFRGWKKDAGRNWSQMLNVEQGSELDIRIAVVKKMIEIIRQHTQEDFSWDSRRLGKKIMLSARPEESAGLQQFLLREFFPDYSPPRR
ncbi:hypothetical protein GCM10022212_22030 [Actimicrobium antarcticum]|uniref:Uncharacterized protein n=2 Tax=Actimicrobium antarcticum TaxID=1051899 RepID=A0ABP7TBZ1_9BURK